MNPLKPFSSKIIALSTAALVLASATAAAGLDKSDQESLASGVVAAAQSGNAVSALSIAGQRAVQYWFPNLGENSPDWAKRIDFRWQFNADTKPEYSVLTVQPLYQTPDLGDTIFVQGSYLHYNMLGEYRDTSNIGIGYRKLLLGNKALVGGNVFYDREWTHGHERVGLGAEAKWSILDFYMNDYTALTGNMDLDVGTNLIERAMSGWDMELRSQMPFLPWARVGVQRYSWKSHYADEDIGGWKVSTDMDLTPNLRLEIGDSSSATPSGTTSAGDGGFYTLLRFHLANTSVPVATSNQLVSSRIFEVDRDMSTHTLDEVRRQNKIVVERKNTSTGSVIIARGN